MFEWQRGCDVGRKLKNLAKPSTMASETHRSSFPSNSDTRKISYRPTIQHGNHIFLLSRHGPIICHRCVTAQASVVNMLQPENRSSSRFGPRIICFCVVYGPCFLDLRHDKSERVSFGHVHLTF